jgi:hypothetical protein
VSNVIKLEFGKPTEELPAASTYDQGREVLRASISKTLTEEQFGSEIVNFVANTVSRRAMDSIEEIDKLGSFATNVQIPPGMDLATACQSAIDQVREQMWRQMIAIREKAHLSIAGAATSGVTALARAITASLSKR